jgi:small subunit ribosomal protein S24e
MEIEIQSKKNNQLLNRTEVHFIIHHKGEGTPNREIIRSELADKLNVKKEKIMVDHMTSDFGIQNTVGYAKVYSSIEKAKDGERTHILQRNNVIAKEKPKKEEKKEEEIPAEKPEEKPEAGEEAPKDEEKPEEAAEETPKEEEKPEDQPSEQPPETPQEPEKAEEKPAEEKKEEA